jgi:hypothetical protein
VGGESPLGDNTPLAIHSAMAMNSTARLTAPGEVPGAGQVETGSLLAVAGDLATKSTKDRSGVEVMELSHQ